MDTCLCTYEKIKGMGYKTEYTPHLPDVMQCNAHLCLHNYTTLVQLAVIISIFIFSTNILHRPWQLRLQLQFQFLQDPIFQPIARSRRLLLIVGLMHPPLMHYCKIQDLGEIEI